jgi:hypothetical protein
MGLRPSAPSGVGAGSENGSEKAQIIQGASTEVGGGSVRPRIELMIKSYGADALKGDVGAAAVLLKMRAHFEKHGDINPERITIVRVMMRPGGKLWADAVAASRERGRLGPFTARR